MKVREERINTFRSQWSQVNKMYKDRTLEEDFNRQNNNSSSPFGSCVCESFFHCVCFPISSLSCAKFHKSFIACGWIIDVFICAVLVFNVFMSLYIIDITFVGVLASGKESLCSTVLQYYSIMYIFCRDGNILGSITLPLQKAGVS